MVIGTKYSTLRSFFSVDLLYKLEHFQNKDTDEGSQTQRS